MDELTKILRKDLSEAKNQWAFKEKIHTITNLKEAWQKKLEYIKSVLLKMETEVLGAPVVDTKKDEDTSKHRQHEELPQYLSLLQKAKRGQEERGNKGGQIGNQR